MNYNKGQHTENGPVYGLRAVVVIGYDQSRWNAIGTLGTGWGANGLISIKTSSTDIKAVYEIGLPA